MRHAGTLRNMGTTSASLCILVIAVGVIATTASASHIRTTNIHWSTGSGPNEIDFTIQRTLRASFVTSCRDPETGSPAPCSGPNGMAGVGDIHKSSETSFVTDGFPISIELWYVVTDADYVNNWVALTAIDHTQLPEIVTTISVVYPSTGTYVPRIQDCCRLSASNFPNRHILNTDEVVHVETIVGDGVPDSASAIPLVPPIVYCPIDAVCTFPVSAVHPNGNDLQFRFSLPSESNDFQQPPGATIDPETGVITWDTTGVSLGGVDPSEWNVLYSTHVTIETLVDQGLIDNRTAVDFFIQLTPDGSGPAEFTIGPCDETLTITAGTRLSFPVQAETDDAKGLVTLDVVGLPDGATMDPSLPVDGNPVSSAFVWTPSSADAGTYIVTFSVIDAHSQQVLCPVTIVVEAAECPADLNGDGVVDVLDLIELINNWGTCP